MKRIISPSGSTLRGGYMSVAINSVDVGLWSWTWSEAKLEPHSDFPFPFPFSFGFARWCHSFSFGEFSEERIEGKKKSNENLML